jgi:hypothetical protein
MKNVSRDKNRENRGLCRRWLGRKPMIIFGAFATFASLISSNVSSVRVTRAFLKGDGKENIEVSYRKEEEKESYWQSTPTTTTTTTTTISREDELFKPEEYDGRQSPDHQNKTAVMTTTTTTTTATTSATTPATKPANMPANMPATTPVPSALRPCRVAVTNSFATHYETLESIASLFPLDALNMTTGCDKHNIQFDFHVETRQKDKRVKLWVDYFETTLKGTNVNASSPRATDADDKVSRRTFGELQVHEHTGTYILAVPRQRSSNNMTSMVLFYDATIEASCYCSPRQLKWMKADAGRSCIFHEQCPHMIADPRAV